MAKPIQTNTYTQGHSGYTVANHQRRTAESDGAFLLPFLGKTDRILDVGCGPGTITLGFLRYATEGHVVGVDVSAAVLDQARALATAAGIPSEGPASAVFEHGNVLAGLPYPDDSFDVVFSSQLLGHFPPPDLPRQALAEMRRVLKPGGLLATRAGASSRFFPRSCGLDRLWGENQRKVLRRGVPDDVDDTGPSLPAYHRSVGFDVGGGRVQVGAAAAVSTGPEARRFLAWRAAGQLTPGDPFYRSWVEAGISEDEIQETRRAVEAWADTDDAYVLMVQLEILAWK